MTKLFHYTRGPIKKFQKGLIPKSELWSNQKLEKEFPWVKDKFSFCFLDSPVPREWIVNFSGEYWRKIRGRNGNLLLSFDVNELDEAYILDYSYLAKLGTGIKTLGFEGYFQSRIKLSRYSGGYELPECIIANVVSRDRLSITGNINSGTEKYTLEDITKSAQIITEELNMYKNA